MCAENSRNRQKISMLLTLKNILEIKDYHVRGIFPIFNSRFQKRDFKKKAKMFVTTTKGMLIREVNGVFLTAVGDDDTERIKSICRYAHDKYGHNKIGKSWKRIRAHCMGFRKQHLINWIAKCPICVQNTQSSAKKKKAKKEHASSLVSVTASFSMERLQMDCIDMSEYACYNEDFSYIVHIIDVYSRYHFAFPAQNKDTHEICESLSALFEREGWPHILQTELDVVYTSEEMANLFLANKVLQVYPNKECVPSMKIITRAQTVFKKKLMKSMKATEYPYSWLRVLDKVIAGWNDKFSLSLMNKPNKLFRTDPPDIEQYMQLPTHNGVPF